MIRSVSSGAAMMVRAQAATSPSPQGERAPEQESQHARGITDQQTSPTSAGQELTPDDQKEVTRLRKRDAEVKQHEQAHKAAGGAYAGAPQYEYETGPDGKRYAVGGSVSISTSAVSGDPAATVRKMEQVIRAALAPAQPSGQDRSVASSAQAKIARARAEMQAERQPEESEDGGAGMRAAGAYAKVAAPEVEVSTMKKLACQKCGGAHAM